MKKTLITTAILSLSFISSMVHAQPVRVLNQNFESDVIQPTLGYNSYISGWVNSGFGAIGAKAPIEGTDYTDMGDRGQVAFLDHGARLTQAVGTQLQENETYTLSFEAGRPVSELGQQYIVRFKANGLALAQLQVDGDSLAAGAWESKSFSFTASSNMPIGKPLVVEFQNTATVTGQQLHIDNVAVTKAGTGKALPDAPIGDNGLNMIPVNLTLKVPESYDTINDALDYLEGLHIKAGKTVTIKVSNCSTQIFDKPITMTHPQGEQIHIIGNLDSPANCVLNFLDSSGFVAINNHSFGLIDGFHINGRDAANTSGVFADLGGNITLGSNTWVSNFENGVYAYRNGRIFADSTASFSNTQNGYRANLNGLIHANNASSYDNSLDGYQTHNSSYIFADSSTALNNSFRGYFADNAGYLNADNTISTTSGREAYYSHDGSMITAQKAIGTGFSGHRFRAYFISQFDRTNAEVNSLSPGLGRNGNSGSTMK